MPSSLRALRLPSALVVTGGVLASMFVTGTAHADSCLTVDATGACLGTGPTVPSVTVGGPTTVGGGSTPGATVPAPTSVCLLVTCVAKGDPLVTVPSVAVPSVTVPVPQETTPTVTVPVGSPTVETYLYTCTLPYVRGATGVTTFGNAVRDLESGNVAAAIDDLLLDVSAYGDWILGGGPVLDPFGYADTCVQ